MDKPIRRGLSAASKDAAKFLEKHPDTTAAELAKRFRIAITTVYRAPWWKKKYKEKSA